MKILNFLFSRSKQEQDKPIRDKLKTRKDFERVLAEDLDIMETTKARIDTAKNINLYMYRSLSYSYILILQSKYSVDAKIDELRDIYIKSMHYFLQAFNKRNPIYADILNYVSLGVLLNIPDAYFRQLIDYVEQMDKLAKPSRWTLRDIFFVEPCGMDKQAKPSGWTPDLLLWFMLNSRMKEQEKQKYAETLAYPRLYNGLYKVIQAPNAAAAKDALNKYLDRWYNLNSDAPWYNSHLKDNSYRGYWAWEVAAVAKIMHIDDSDLKNNQYYPYDMVHWADNETTAKE